MPDLFMKQKTISTFNNACIVKMQLVAMLQTSCVIFNYYSSSTSNHLFLHHLQGVLQVVLVVQPNPHKENNRKESCAKDSLE